MSPTYQFRPDSSSRDRSQPPGGPLISLEAFALRNEPSDTNAVPLTEAILSGATDASTAGTARLAGMAVSGVFMLTRRGRDVVLPNLTEMNIILNHPLILYAGESASPATVKPGSGGLVRPSLASRQ